MPSGSTQSKQLIEKFVSNAIPVWLYTWQVPLTGSSFTLSIISLIPLIFELLK